MKITCLECGKKLRQINYKHLAYHSLSIPEYCFKYKVKRSDLISENTRALKVKSQSKCIEFLKKARRATGEQIRAGMKKGRIKHFWGNEISKAMAGKNKSENHRQNLSKSKAGICQKLRILTAQKIDQIRKEYQRGKHGYGYESLAKKHNVSSKLIYTVINRKNGYRWI